MRAKLTSVITFTLVVVLCWSLFGYISLHIENSHLKETISKQYFELQSLKSTVTTLEKRLSSFQASPSITYCTYEYNRRLVTRQLEVFLYPGSKALKVPGNIEPYTVVNVLGSGLLENEERELWLYVEFPVYDTPMDYRGWIRESDTVAITKENRTLIKNAVLIRRGISIYEVGSVEEIQKSNGIRLPESVAGKIDKNHMGYAHIICGGGWTFWVEEKYIEYPPIE